MDDKYSIRIRAMHYFHKASILAYHTPLLRWNPVIGPGFQLCTMRTIYDLTTINTEGERVGQDMTSLQLQLINQAQQKNHGI